MALPSDRISKLPKRGKAPKAKKAKMAPVASKKAYMETKVKRVVPARGPH